MSSAVLFFFLSMCVCPMSFMNTVCMQDPSEARKEELQGVVGYHEGMRVLGTKPRSSEKAVSTLSNSALPLLLLILVCSGLERWFIS